MFSEILTPYATPFPLSPHLIVQARETGDWFANEFRKAMIPLYSVQQGVIHSNYFEDVAKEIGRYPNRLL